MIHINNFMKQPTDLTENGQCSRCAGCCSATLPVTEQELAQMKAYADRIGFTPVIPGDKKDDIVYLMCPFLTPKTALTVKRTCAIYDARPEICRAFICSQKNHETLAAYTRNTGGKTPSKTVNVWKVYNKTGLRKNGVEIPYDDADFAQLEDDNGRKIQFQVGQPLNITLTNGQYLHNVICIGIFDNAMQVANEDGIRNIEYDSIQTINM